MANGFDPEEFELDLDETLRRSRDAFNGRYREQLEQLMGLSAEEVALMCPDVTSMQEYDELITVVKEASRVNLAQAQLKQQIERLGTVALRIAGRIPSLARILV